MHEVSDGIQDAYWLKAGRSVPENLSGYSILLLVLHKMHHKEERRRICIQSCCAGDGKLRVYFVGYPPGELLCALRAVPSKPAGAALSALSVHTRSQAADPAARGPVTVVVGDTKGAVRVWEIAEPGKLTRGCREEDARACFRQVRRSWLLGTWLSCHGRDSCMHIILLGQRCDSPVQHVAQQRKR